MKKFLLLCLVLSFMGAKAGEPGVTFLFKDGKKASFLFSTKPELKVGASELTLTATDVATPLSYTITDVEKFYFESNLVTAISGAKAAADGSHPVFSCSGGAVTVSGLKAGESVSVYNIGGIKVCGAIAGSDGCASVDISGAASGVYVISTGSGVSFKLLKK